MCLGELANSLSPLLAVSPSAKHFSSPLWSPCPLLSWGLATHYPLELQCRPGRWLPQASRTSYGRCISLKACYSAGVAGCSGWVNRRSSRSGLQGAGVSLMPLRWLVAELAALSIAKLLIIEAAIVYYIVPDSSKRKHCIRRTTLLSVS